MNWRFHFLIPFFLYGFVGPLIAQKQKTDSLYKVWKNPALHDTIRLEALNKFARQIIYVKPDSALQLGKEAFAWATRIKKPRFQSNACTISGVAYVFKGDNQKAEYYFTESLKYAEISGDKTMLSYAYGNLGNLFRQQSNFLKSIDYQIKSLKLKEGENDKLGQALSYNNIGNLYIEIKDYSKAKEYYEKGLGFAREIHDKNSVALLLANLVTIYNEENNYEKSMSLLQESYAIRKEINDKIGMVSTLLSLGLTARQMKDHASSLNYLKQAEELAIELGNDQELQRIYDGLFYTYRALEKKDLAFEYAKRNFEIAQKMEITQKKEAATTMYYGLKDLGKKAEALEWLEAAGRMKDSLVKQESGKEFIKRQYQFDYEKKQQADSLKSVEEKRLAAVKYEQEIKQQRWLVYVACGGFVFVLLIAILIFRGLQQKKKSNKMLESANSLLEETNKEVTKQKELVEEKQKEIIDSINYAQRIQHAVLTGDEIWDKISSEHFILHKPKDIVSGDYYWAYVAPNRKCVWALGDCTGHGVPGAFMSMLGNSYLNEIVVENHIFNPDQILNRLRNKIISALEQKGEQRKDGMDMAVCVWNKIDNTLEFSGANNSILILRNGQLNELKGDKMPVGKHEGELKSFSAVKVKLEKGDIIYMYTDGYADQFGGEKGKKFKYKPLQNLLLVHATQNMKTQKDILEGEFDKWRGQLDQVDDVSLIGIKVL